VQSAWCNLAGSSPLRLAFADSLVLSADIGLSEIKAAGGISIVQDPSEAIFRGMPDSAIQSLDVDHILKLSEIGQFLANL
jgi:hypothetical protein